jgi:hypothetical protein
MGISVPTLRTMSASDSPMLGADAAALLAAFGLSFDDQ